MMRPAPALPKIAITGTSSLRRASCFPEIGSWLLLVSAPPLRRAAAAATLSLPRYGSTSPSSCSLTRLSLPRNVFPEMRGTDTSSPSGDRIVSRRSIVVRPRVSFPWLMEESAVATPVHVRSLIVSTAQFFTEASTCLCHDPDPHDQREGLFAQRAQDPFWFLSR